MGKAALSVEIIVNVKILSVKDFNSEIVPKILFFIAAL